MKIDISEKALAKMNQLGKEYCCLNIKSGGCYGTTVNFSFTKSAEDQLFMSVKNKEVFANIVAKTEDEEMDILIDYEESLFKSGFIVKSLNSRTCCCNKSFGRKLSKGNCVQL